MTKSEIASVPDRFGKAGRALKIVLVYNPEAGNFSAETLVGLRSALERAGHDVITADSLEFRLPASPDALDLVCIVGGDGTARTVMCRNREVAQNAAFCIFPAGTVNLVASEADYAKNVAAFVRDIADRRDARRHFLGELNGQAFLCCASVGPDSAVVARTSPSLKRRFGRLAYIIALLGQIWEWPRHSLRVTVDGTCHKAEAIFICKGRYYAGPWMLDAHAALHSDDFRVLLLHRARRRDIFRLALSAIVSQRLADPRWLRLTARNVELFASQALPIQADGDILATTPAVIRIIPEPFSFL